MCTGKHGRAEGNELKRWHSDAMPQSPAPRSENGPGRRFLTLADVAEILATSVAQVRALVQSGELRYIQIGGRQQYRIEAVELEDYIQRMYAKAERQRSAGSSAEEPQV
jgi:excisionase family DNA binding protein